MKALNPFDVFSIYGKMFFTFSLSDILYCRVGKQVV
jgi:hypothetical protein